MTASRTPVGPTIGIDFGTTNTVIAVADADGRTEAPDSTNPSTRSSRCRKAISPTRFQHADINIQRSITRNEFESWIREDVDHIAGTVDEALRNAGVAAAEIDKVFLTGGSSFIPAIQRIFADRFGADRLASGDQFESIAYGLALIGQSANLGDWIVKPW